MGTANKNKTLARVPMVPRCTKTYKGGGKKLLAYAMAIVNILVTNMHIVGCLPVIIYLLVSLIQAAMTGNDAVAYTAVTILHLLYQLRTHTGNLVCIWCWLTGPTRR